jgi:hypothetical protein
MRLALVVGDATDQSGDVWGKTLRFLDRARLIAGPSMPWLVGSAARVAWVP